MNRWIGSLCLALTLIMASQTAMAKDNAVKKTNTVQGDLDSSWKPAIGVRVGGYGFRQLDTDETMNWNNCRMNGVGIYSTLDLNRNFFAELSADMYHAHTTTMRQGLDRISLHTAAVINARMAPDFLISPFIQLGAGVEYTWVDIYGNKDQGLVPVGFVGLGGEINLDQFKLGMTIRSNAMQLPDYDWRNQSKQEVTYKTELAGQMLFSVRYVL